MPCGTVKLALRHEATFRWLLAGGLAVLGFAVYAQPRATLHGGGLHDLVAFFDGINALAHGRTPSLDFHTPLGALGHLIPYWGFLLAGQFGGALESAGALVAAFLLLLACAGLQGRASRSMSALFLLALFGMACIPWSPGDGAAVVSQGGYYNRWGWAALAVLLLLGVLRLTAGKWGTDALVVAACLLFTFFLKMTYFACAMGFVVVCGLGMRRFVQAGLVGIGAFAVVALAVGVATDAVWPYLKDVGMAAQAADVGVVGWRDNLRPLWWESLLAAAACAVAVRKNDLAKDMAMPLLAALACLLLALQNTAMASAFALLPVFVQAHTLAARRARGGRAIAVRWLMVAFLLPQFFSQAVATGHFLSVAHGGGGWGWYRPLGLPRTGSVHLWAADMQYAKTIHDGVELLRTAGSRCSTVAALDSAQPFSAILGIPPPHGFVWVFNVGRFIPAKGGPSSEALFADVQCVMHSNSPLDPASSAAMRDAHQEYLTRRFRLAAKSADWRLYEKSSPPKI